ncbi:MAG: hypothetical protein GX307_07565 [Euryarchaeota archaeon]|nr:hypothetical protein [Euryarchaeota archaeon]
MIEVRADNAKIVILPVIKGLVADGDAAARAIREALPDAVGVSLSREELAALRDKSVYDDYEMGTLEKVYAERLSEFGEVELPSPCFVSALDTCVELCIPIIPLDMNDVDFTEAYCECVKATDIVRESFFTRRARRSRFDLTSPQAFVQDWDRKVNRSRGFHELERLREEHMAMALRKMTRKYHNILAVVEAERADGVGDQLNTTSRRD